MFELEVFYILFSELWTSRTTNEYVAAAEIYYTNSNHFSEKVEIYENIYEKLHPIIL